MDEAQILGRIVAPFAGAWIEIPFTLHGKLKIVSLPSRERGLKSVNAEEIGNACYVAPFAGAWIEIRCKITPTHYRPRRSLRGSVD